MLRLSCAGRAPPLLLLRLLIGVPNPLPGACAHLQQRAPCDERNGILPMSWVACQHTLLEGLGAFTTVRIESTGHLGQHMMCVCKFMCYWRVQQCTGQAAWRTQYGSKGPACSVCEAATMTARYDLLMMATSVPTQNIQLQWYWRAVHARQHTSAACAQHGRQHAAAAGIAGGCLVTSKSRGQGCMTAHPAVRGLNTRGHRGL